jgi:ATP-dependent exoDNAse (exonuclease V) alpha subunit
LHSFFNSLERQAGQHTAVAEGEIQNNWNFDGLSRSAHKEVWFVDEANMIDTNLMSHLQQAALLRKAAVIYLGDYRQLPPIGGGHAYSRLILEDRIHSFDLKTSFRQRDALETVRRAVEEAALGRIEQSLDWLRNNTFEYFHKDERFTRLAAMYAHFKPQERSQSVIITGTNRDRIDLNLKVHRILKNQGFLSEGAWIPAGDIGERAHHLFAQPQGPGGV